MEHNSRRHPHAFTLVELLVVIAVIAVLTAMLLPSLHRARQQAKNVACANNQRQLVMGVHMYVMNNDGWMPNQVNWGASLFSPALARSAFNWDEPAQYTGLGLLYHWNYVTSPATFWCASEDAPHLTAGSRSGSGMARLPLGTVAVDTTYWYRFGFGMRYGGTTGNRTGPLCAKLTTLKRPDDGVLMCAGWNGGGNEPNYIRASHLHLDRGFNLAFVDGHVSWMDASMYPRFYSTSVPQNGQTVPANRHDYKTNRYRADMPTLTINRATQVYHGAWRMPS
jgi:prepilin-type N-terminal cleavage/methylation domain-containing protein/prepilin-type processing-associated H-X9-DG protein